MKTSTILLCFVMTVSSCVNETRTSLDQSKRDSITKEIEIAINQILDSLATRNINTAYSLFLNSSDFTFIGGDGTITDYSSIIKMSKPAFDAWKEVKYELLDKKIKIIDQNNVIALINNTCDIKYLNGTIEKYSKVGCTIVFNKINNKWWVTHFQESTLVPEIILPEKK